MISENEFRRIWGVNTAPSGDLFEFDAASKHPLHHVLTVVETGDDRDGNWYALPGYHVINKIGYVLTEKPWVDDTPDAVYFLDDMDSDDEVRFLDDGIATS